MSNIREHCSFRRSVQALLILRGCDYDSPASVRGSRIETAPDIPTERRFVMRTEDAHSSIIRSQLQPFGAGAGSVAAARRRERGRPATRNRDGRMRKKESEKERYGDSSPLLLREVSLVLSLYEPVTGSTAIAITRLLSLKRHATRNTLQDTDICSPGTRERQ